MGMDEPGFESWYRQGFYLRQNIQTSSKATQPRIQCVLVSSQQKSSHTVK